MQSILLVVSAMLASPQTLLQYMVTAQGCVTDVSINGFPSTEKSDAATHQGVITPYLIKGENRIDAHWSGKDCTLTLTLERAKVGTFDFEVLDKIDSEKVEGDSASLTFKSAVGGFEQVLGAEKSTADEALAYAMKLQKWIKANNKAALLAAMEPKIDRVVQALGGSKEQAAEQLGTMVATFSKKMKLAPKRAIVADALLGGRLWRVRRKSHKNALVVIQEDGGTMTLELYVAKVGGEMRVVE